MATARKETVGVAKEPRSRRRKWGQFNDLELFNVYRRVTGSTIDYDEKILRSHLVEELERLQDEGRA